MCALCTSRVGLRRHKNIIETISFNTFVNYYQQKYVRLILQDTKTMPCSTQSAIGTFVCHFFRIGMGGLLYRWGFQWCRNWFPQQFYGIPVGPGSHASFSIIEKHFCNKERKWVRKKNESTFVGWLRKKFWLEIFQIKISRYWYWN